MTVSLTVYPTKETAKVLVHPTHGKISINGSIWPKDAFTNRRLADKSITTVKPGTPAQVAPVAVATASPVIATTPVENK